MKITLAEFRLIRDLIHENTGIFLKEEKLYFLESRIDMRCREVNCDTVQDYYRFLKYDSTGEELRQLIELITVNETYFFRDAPQLKAFAQEALPQVVAKKVQQNDTTLRMWCAGCSSGEEAYTLAILASEVVKNIRCEIIATDINQKVLDIAKKGIYNGRSLKDMPIPYLTKYFKKIDEGYLVDDSLKAMINFWTLNLIDKVRMKLIYNIDFIFCRNVLIYFSEAQAKQVVNYFYDSLNKGGYIFFGHAESMHLLSGAFRLVKFRELIGYMKE